jgi:hypothetical protein
MDACSRADVDATSNVKLWNPRQVAIGRRRVTDSSRAMDANYLVRRRDKGCGAEMEGAKMVRGALRLGGWLANERKGGRAGDRNGGTERTQSPGRNARLIGD